jgi:hypothetical protein
VKLDRQPFCVPTALIRQRRILASEGWTIGLLWAIGQNDGHDRQCWRIRGLKAASIPASRLSTPSRMWRRTKRNASFREISKADRMAGVARFAAEAELAVVH